MDIQRFQHFQVGLRTVGTQDARAVVQSLSESAPGYTPPESFPEGQSDAGVTGALTRFEHPELDFACVVQPHDLYLVKSDGALAQLTPLGDLWSQILGSKGQKAPVFVGFLEGLVHLRFRLSARAAVGTGARGLRNVAGVVRLLGERQKGPRMSAGDVSSLGSYLAGLRRGKPARPFEWALGHGKTLHVRGSYRTDLTLSLEVDLPRSTRSSVALPAGLLDKWNLWLQLEAPLNEDNRWLHLNLVLEPHAKAEYLPFQSALALPALWESVIKVFRSIIDGPVTDVFDGR